MTVPKHVGWPHVWAVPLGTLYLYRFIASQLRLFRRLVGIRCVLNKTCWVFRRGVSEKVTSNIALFL